MLLAGTLGLLGLNRQADLGRVPLPGVSATSASPTVAVTTPRPPSATPSGKPDDSAAMAALRACRAKVKAADEVLAAAKPGMQNWADHVQAQTDVDSGAITESEMEDIFDRTRRAGDEDEKRYNAAVRNYEDQDGSCREAAGASTRITEQLTRCSKRAQAQEPVLAAAEDGMADWIKHLGDMRRSDQGKIHNPAQQWREAWRAAPRNIEAYEEAAEKFSGPDC